MLDILTLYPMSVWFKMAKSSLEGPQGVQYDVSTGADLVWTDWPFLLQIGVRFSREEDTVPYMVSQPLPWQVHSVSHSRRSSKAEEVSAHTPARTRGALFITDPP